LGVDQRRPVTFIEIHLQLRGAYIVRDTSLSQ
jgi:hypothetical protein